MSWAVKFDFDQCSFVIGKEGCAVNLMIGQYSQFDKGVKSHLFDFGPYTRLRLPKKDGDR